MPTYVVRIAVRGMTDSWRVTKVQTHNAKRAILVAETRERDEGYDPLALKAENETDAHDYAEQGIWPFAQ